MDVIQDRQLLLWKEYKSVAIEALANSYSFECTLVSVDPTNVSARKKTNKLPSITSWLVLKNNEVSPSQIQASLGKSEQWISVYICRRLSWIEKYVTKDIGGSLWKRVL